MKSFWHKRTRWLMGPILILLFSLSSTVFGADKIKLGIIGPMKFIVGEHTMLGATLAAEEINNAGGVVIKGKKYEIELVKADSNELASLPDAVSAMERLITGDKVDFILGGYHTEPCLAMQEVTADYKKIWLSSGTASLKLCERIASDYKRYKYTFRVGCINQLFMGNLNSLLLAVDIEKVKKELGVERPRVALLHEKGVWAEMTAEAVLKQNQKENYELVGKWVVSGAATDVSAEMTAIKNANPHIIFDIVAGSGGVAFSKAWGELRIPATLTGCNVPAMADAHWKATTGNCNYEHYASSLGPVEVTEKTVPFFNNFRAKYKQAPIYIASGTYDGVYVLKGAIERAGSLETEAVIVALEKTDYRGVQGRIKFFPNDHKFPHDLMWGPGLVTQVHMQWQDGNSVVVWPDGVAYLGQEGFKGLKYKGTRDYILPPRMVEYWKAQRK